MSEMGQKSETGKIRQGLTPLIVTTLFLGIIAASHLFIFRVFETDYEHKIRTFIARAVTNLANYEAWDDYNTNGNLSYQSPLAVNQIIVISDSLIATTDRLVFRENSDIKVRIRSRDSLKLTVSEFRNFTPKAILTSDFKPTVRPPEVSLSTLNGFDQHDFDTFVFKPSPHYTGWIQLRIESSRATRNIPIFVEGKQSSDVLFVESTDTMKAYKSNYGLRTNYVPGARKLYGDFTRPDNYPVEYELKLFGRWDSIENIDCEDHLANADFVIKHGLVEMGLSFDNASDEFLDHYDNFKNYKLVIFGAHNEYWTEAKFQNLGRYIDEGGSVLFLGGNTAYRHIKKMDGFAIIWGADLLHAEFGEWIKKYLGSYYTARGYKTYAPFEMSEDTASTPLLRNRKAGEAFGIGTSFDACKKKITGVSGHETDKYVDQARDFILIASGKNENNAGADIVFKAFDSGGYVLNFGSVSTWHGMNDPVIIELIRDFTHLVMASKQ